MRYVCDEWDRWEPVVERVMCALLPLVEGRNPTPATIANELSHYWELLFNAPIVNAPIQGAGYFWDSGTGGLWRINDSVTARFENTGDVGVNFGVNPEGLLSYILIDWTTPKFQSSPTPAQLTQLNYWLDYEVAA